MDTKCKTLLERYVRSETAIACLELCGYTSEDLVRNIDSNQIDQIEDFVRHACTIMSANNSRIYLGNVFFSHPNKFCFPIGIRMGIMMAVNELRGRKGVDQAVQTDPFLFAPWSSSNPAVDRAYCRDTREHNGSSIDLTDDDTPRTSSSSTIGLPRTFSVPLLSSAPPLSSAMAIVSSSSYTPFPTLPCPPNSATSAPSAPSAPAVNNGFFSTYSDSYDSQLEHLKAHSSASIIRLVSRQFLNASLVQDQHFNITMEIVPSTPEQPRITGIFHCHLCRERRTRSTAVRFSVSRNRYPVMSNVLSHLKIHFQVRPVSLSFDKMNSTMKKENTTCSDSSTGLDSLSPFNLDQLINNSNSLSSEFKL